MKLMPASRARWMMWSLSSWSLVPHSPNIMAPRHRGETWTPVRPSGRSSMVISFLVVALGWRLWSGLDEHLERGAVGHRPVTVGDVVQADSQVEDLSRLDAAVEHVRAEERRVGKAGRPRSRP